MNVYCRDLGQMDYKACWDLQQSLFDVLTAGKTNRTAAPESATPSSEEALSLIHICNEVRDEVARRKFGAKFADLPEEDRNAISKAVPLKISEAEPRNIKK